MTPQEEIQEKYPKALAEYFKYHFGGDMDVDYASDIHGMFGVPQYHDLECFFDSCGIYIEITTNGMGTAYVWQIPSVNWIGHQGTRTEAKQAAFLKAFEILEKQLNETPKLLTND